MDCACYLTEDLLSVLRCLRMDVTKKPCRALNACVEGYRKDNCRVMRSDLYNNLTKYTKEFYVSLSKDMTIYRMQYQQALLDRRITTSVEVEQIVARTYVIRELVRFVLALDRKFSRRMSDLLGRDITYTTEDNHYCVEMINTLTQMLRALGIPLDLETHQTDMAFKVFISCRMNMVMRLMEMI